MAQQVTKKDIPGISTFAQVETTIACGGSTKPEAIPRDREHGLQVGDQPAACERAGRTGREEGTAVKAAGMNYVHLPFDAQNPDAHLIDNFIAAVTAPGNQPAHVHCAAGGRAASLWMVKRVLADGWDEQRALTEANALGLNDRFRPFALNYIHSHGSKSRRSFFTSVGMGSLRRSSRRRRWRRPRLAEAPKARRRQVRLPGATILGLRRAT